LKKIDLSQTITILANLGVIAGIVFLGIEINQNTASNQSAVRQSMAQSEVDLLFFVSENPDLLFDPESLNEDQFGELQLLLIAFARTRESYWLEYQNGFLDRETFDSYLRPFVSMIPRTDMSRACGR
jgi:hypothetical protein